MFLISGRFIINGYDGASLMISFFALVDANASINASFIISGFYIISGCYKRYIYILFIKRQFLVLIEQYQYHTKRT
jgi:hypothetical protein